MSQVHQMAAPNDVESILSSISSAGASFAKQDAGAREQLLAHAYKLAAAVETPSEAIQRIGWAEVGSVIILLTHTHIFTLANENRGQPARYAAMQMAVDLKIFDKLTESDGKAVNTAELAKHTGAEDALICRRDDTVRVRRAMDD